MPGFAEYPNMVFVDGENFTIRGQEFAKTEGVKLIKGEWWEPDTFLWMPKMYGEQPEYARTGWWRVGDPRPDIRSQRAYYYTAVVGDERKLRKARLAIRAIGFEPNVFKKPKNTKSKGVDVSLTTALVSHAYRDSYEVAFLIAGDGDYVPMVEEAKRAGKRVVVAFFEKHGLNDELRIAADHFIDLSEWFTRRWEAEKADQEKAASS